MEETRTQTKTRSARNDARVWLDFCAHQTCRREGSSDSFFGVENDDDDDDSHNNIDAEEKERDVAFCIDRGGTFTDVYCEYVESGRKKKLAVKLLSEDPKNYTSAPREGIRRALEIITREPIPRRAENADGED